MAKGTHSIIFFHLFIPQVYTCTSHNAPPPHTHAYNSPTFSHVSDCTDLQNANTCSKAHTVPMLMMFSVSRASPSFYPCDFNTSPPPPPGLAPLKWKMNQITNILVCEELCKEPGTKLLHSHPRELAVPRLWWADLGTNTNELTPQEICIGAWFWGTVKQNMHQVMSGRLLLFLFFPTTWRKQTVWWST